MNPIQILLLFALTAVALLYFRLLRHRRGGLIIFGAFFLLGVLAVIFPDATTWLANRLGVQRGADLLLYFTVVISYAAIGLLYGKIRKLEERQNVILREITLLRGTEE